MYSNLLPALLLCITLIVTIFIIEWLLPTLTKKGINTTKAIETTANVIKIADTLAESLQKLFPASPIAAVADKIIDYARIGVQKAEQLYYISTIQGDERKDTAVKFVNDALELAGIERNAAIDKIVDGAIEAAVLGLGHYEEEVTIIRKTVHDDDEPPDAVGSVGSDSSVSSDSADEFTPDMSDPETARIVSELLAENTITVEMTTTLADGTTTARPIEIFSNQFTVDRETIPLEGEAEYAAAVASANAVPTGANPGESSADWNADNMPF